MLKNLATVSGLTLLSRILGFARDMVVSYYLGATTKVADAWMTALAFPNMFRRVFGEGAFNSAFVPLYGKKVGKGDDVADNYASRVLILMGFSLAVIFAISFIFMRPIMWVMSSGFDAEKLDLTVRLSRITVGYLLFICLVAGYSGILNTRKVFGAPAISYAMLNVVFLAGLFIFAPRTGNPEFVLAWSTLVAGVIQLLIVIIACKKRGLKFIWQKPKIDSDIKKLGLLMVPGLLSASIQQINFIVGQTVASHQEGGKSFLYYAERIHQLPLGLIGIAFGIVLLPEITNYLRDGKEKEARDSLANGLELAVFLAIPAMIGMAVIAEPILYSLFAAGEFTADNARMAGNALIAFSFGVPAYVLIKVLQPGYFAREDTKTPMKFTFVSAVINIILCMTALYFLKGTGNLHVGCAIASSVAGWVNLVLLWWGLKKRGQLVVPVETMKKIGLMLIAALVMGSAVWIAGKLLDPIIHGDQIRPLRILLITLIGSFGITAYFLVAHLTGAMSISNLKANFRR